MELRPEEISRIIRSQIKHYEAKINQSETGTVILIGDGIAKAAGLTGCMVNELLEFPGGVYGMAQNLEENSVSIVMLGNEDGIRAFEAELYPWMEANAADVLTAIRETKDLSKETEALLNKAITTRVAEFLQNQ